MYSRSLNYNSGSNHMNGYSNNQLLTDDTVNFPTLSPYSFANQPSYAYPSTFQSKQF